MSPALLIAAALVPQAAAPPPQRGEPVALVGATVVDGTDRPPISDAVVVIRDGRIEAVGRAADVAVPRGARRLDLTGHTIIPGLVDLHVHLSAVPAVRPAPFGPDDLAAFLAAGVTSLRSAGDATPWIFELQRDLAAGRRVGPRLVAVGPMFTAPGGHPAGTWLRGNPEAAAVFARQMTDPDSARAEVRRLVAAGAGAIKAVYDSGDARTPFGYLPRLDSVVLAAIVAEARARGVRSLVHWQNVRELPTILAIGPDELEHVPVGPLPDSLVRAIADRRIAVTPTAAAFAGFLQPRVLDLLLANVRRLAAAGVTLLVGSDAPLGPAFGGGVHAELELLVRAGLTPQRAIQAATRDAARALGIADLGTITPGQRADLVALGADPLAGIAGVRDVRLVLLDGGEVYRAPPR